MNSDRELGDKVRFQLDQMVDMLNAMPIGMSLVWLWSWDIIRSKYEYYWEEQDEEYVRNPLYTIDNVWEELWANIPEFTLEYGAEQIDNDITDWMMDKEFIIPREEEDGDN